MLYSDNLLHADFVSPKIGAFLAQHDLATLEPGSYDLGEGECVNVFCYQNGPREDRCYEAHNDYIDVQLVISGAEALEVAPREECTETKPYAADGDCALYSNEFEGEQYLLCPGRFIAVWPEDAHMPGICLEDPADVKKAVFKIRA